MYYEDFIDDKCSEKRILHKDEKYITELLKVISGLKYFDDDEISSKVFYLSKKYSVNINDLHNYVSEYMEYGNEKKDLKLFLSNLEVALTIFEFDYIYETVYVEYIEDIAYVIGKVGYNIKKFIYSIMENKFLPMDHILDIKNDKFYLETIKNLTSKLSKSEFMEIISFSKLGFVSNGFNISNKELVNKRLYSDMDLANISLVNILKKLNNIFIKMPDLIYNDINYFTYVGGIEKYLDLVLYYIDRGYTVDIIKLKLKQEFQKDIDIFFQANLGKYFSKNQKIKSPYNILKSKDKKQELLDYKNLIKKQAILISQISRKFQKNFDINKSLEENINNAFRNKSYKILTVEQKIKIIHKMKDFYNKSALIQSLIRDYSGREKELLKHILGKEIKGELDVKQVNSSIVFIIDKEEDFILLHYKPGKAVESAGFNCGGNIKLKELKGSVLVIRKDIKEYVLNTITHEYRHNLNSIIFGEKEYTESGHIKDEIIAYMADGTEKNIIASILMDPKGLYRFDSSKVIKLTSLADEIKRKYPSIFLEILSIVDCKYWDLFI